MVEGVEAETGAPLMPPTDPVVAPTLPPEAPALTPEAAVADADDPDVTDDVAEDLAVT